jgi:hypothetical protein
VGVLAARNLLLVAATVLAIRRLRGKIATFPER